MEFIWSSRYCAKTVNRNKTDNILPSKGSESWYFVGWHGVWPRGSQGKCYKGMRIVMLLSSLGLTLRCSRFQPRETRQLQICWPQCIWGRFFFFCKTNHIISKHKLHCPQVPQQVPRLLFFVTKSLETFQEGVSQLSVAASLWQGYHTSSLLSCRRSPLLVPAWLTDVIFCVHYSI